MEFQFSATLCCIALISIFFNVKTISSASLIIPNTQQNHTILDSSCFDADGIGYTGQIPHTTNCAFYLKCEVLEINSENLPISLLKECSEGLEYSWYHCNCRSPEMGLCFDAQNPEHEAQRFHCATPIRKK